LAYGCPRELHLSTGCPWQERAIEKIAKRESRVGATAFPAADHVIARADQVGRFPEVEIGNASQIDLPANVQQILRVSSK